MLVFARFVIHFAFVSIFHFFACCLCHPLLANLPIFYWFFPLFAFATAIVGPVLATSSVTEGSSVNIVTWLLAPALRSSLSYYYLEFHDLGQFI